MFVHVPLVLMPLLALAAIAVAVRPVWRARFGIVLGLASVAVVAATQIAVQSGEAFDDLLHGQAPIDRHAELARQSRLLAAGFALSLLATVAVAAVQRKRRRGPVFGAPDRGPAAARRPRSRLAVLGHACATVAVLLGMLGTVWMLRTGHEGAKAVWDGTVQDAEDD